MSFEKPIEIYYLYHSGFLIRTARHILIFDYCQKHGTSFTGTLREGKFDPSLFREDNILIFSSHRHSDHFDRRILSWSSILSNATYILSDDIRLNSNEISQLGDRLLQVHFSRRYTLPGDISITTLHSTDEGVAFIVEADGCRIYHAGDLNWWHWEKESKHYNDSMAGQYRHEIDLISSLSMDLSFVPLDPRLGRFSHLGMEYFLKKVSSQMVFPMHFSWAPTSLQALLASPEMARLREKITLPSHPGEKFLYFPKAGNA